MEFIVIEDETSQPNVEGREINAILEESRVKHQFTPNLHLLE